MENSKVSFIPLNKNAVMPKTHSLGAAGYDLFAISDGVVQPFSTLGVKLGFSLHLPPNLVGIICGRSGIGRKNGVNTFGSYVRTKDEIVVYLKNYTDTPYGFEKGTRIAQLFFAVVDDLKLEETGPRIN